MRYLVIEERECPKCEGKGGFPNPHAVNEFDNQMVVCTHCIGRGKLRREISLEEALGQVAHAG